MNVQQVRIRFNKRDILQTDSLFVQPNAKLAIIGANGSGKSSLLKVMAGLEKPFSGTVTPPSDIFYFPQVTSHDYDEQTLSDFFASFYEDWWDITTAIEQSDYFENLDVNRTFGSFSGGEKSAMLMAVMEFLKPSIVLLDEPSNHLDLVLKDKLIKLIQNYSKAVVFVTHDEDLLRQCATCVWEIHDKVLTEYNGDWDFYTEEKRREAQARAKELELLEKKEKKVQTSIDREANRQRMIAHKAEKYRHDKSLSRMDRGYFKGRAQITAGKRDKIYNDKMDEIVTRRQELELPDIKHLYMHLSTNHRRPGTNLITLREVDYTLPTTKHIKPLTFHLGYGDRAAIFGRNGAGKSSFLKALREPEKHFATPHEDDLVIAEDLRILYLDQNYSIINPDKTLLENVASANDTLPPEVVHVQLRNFLFLDVTQWTQKARTLSGGERMRLAMAMISVNPVDIVILDEPTNNLDKVAIDDMIQAIDKYPGALLVVSHNVSFLSQIRLDKGYLIKDHQWKFLPFLMHDAESMYSYLQQEISE